jgi:hypothetical protein
MEKNILITDITHKNIYETYNELKKQLPTKLFRMKVFSTPKYTLEKKPILTRIENEKINSIKQVEKPMNVSKFLSASKKIYILSNKTINLKKKHLKPLAFEQKNDDIFKKTLLTEKDNKNNNIEQNENGSYNYEGLNENMEFMGYNFRPHIINDANMKSNIYLPKIIDRMKYSLPRSERDRGGFLVEGVGIFSNNRIKYDELNDRYEINIYNNTADKKNKSKNNENFINKN